MANHLLNKKENDHVDVHEIRGLATENLRSAFLEIEAVSKGTRAKQPFFAVTFNPPPRADITIDQFEEAFSDVERKMGLENQPRAVVFHEKQGRRHAHVIWSRIDTERMTAIPMSHFKRKLQDVSRDLYLKLGLEMPVGMKNKKRHDPLSFDLQTWQQAKRLKEDPRNLKKIMRQALQASAGFQAFQKALEAQSLFLARGDKRGFVVLHHSGEVMSLTRYSGFKTKEVKQKLGTPENLPNVEEARKIIVARQTESVKKKQVELNASQHQERQPLVAELKTMRSKHRIERLSLKQTHELRWLREELTRAKRLRKGIMGLWDRVTGRRGRISRQNRQESQAASIRDRQEKQNLIDRQMAERRTLQEKFKTLHEQQKQEKNRFRFEMGFQMAKQKGKLVKAWQEKDKPRDGKSLADSWKEATGAGSSETPKLKDQFKEAAKPKSNDKERGHERSREGSRPPNQGPMMN
ncbi:MAG: relaxase/mobilization nuclease domain-containing protein [Nitrospinales bacterium]